MHQMKNFCKFSIFDTNILANWYFYFLYLFFLTFRSQWSFGSAYCFCYFIGLFNLCVGLADSLKKFRMFHEEGAARQSALNLVSNQQKISLKEIFSRNNAKIYRNFFFAILVFLCLLEFVSEYMGTISDIRFD